MLRTIGVQWQAFDVAIVADGDGVDLFRNQVFERDLAQLLLDDLRLAFLAVLVAQVFGVLANDGADVLLVAEQLFVAADLATKFVVFLEDCVPFQGGELAELQTDDGFRLGFAHVVARLLADLLLQRGEMIGAERAFHQRRGNFKTLQAFLGAGPAGRAAANLDHFVKRRNRDQLPFENMAAPLRLAQQIVGAPANHLHAMAQELFEHLLDRQRARPAVNQSE